jgi:hypothetical protein
VLADHVLSEIEAIDRMYLHLYQPRLQHRAGIAAFAWRKQRRPVREHPARLMWVHG